MGIKISAIDAPAKIIPEIRLKDTNLINFDPPAPLKAAKRANRVNIQSLPINSVSIMKVPSAAPGRCLVTRRGKNKKS